MKYLIILNRRFPYKYGEAFLENEVDEISCYFDTIMIFPSDMTYKDSMTRKIKSKNVNVYAIGKHSVKMRNASYCVGGIFDAKDGSAKTVHDWLYSGYFNRAANSQAEGIWRVLKNIHFKDSDEIVIYSYWFFINAKAATLLRNKFPDNVTVKCISRAHNFDIYEDKRFLPDREYLLLHLDYVFPCSDNGTEYLKRKYPMYAEKINTAFLGTYDRGKQNMKRKHGEFHIVSCSRTDPEKRVELMIQAMKYLADDNIQYSWTHIGGGSMLESIKKQAEQVESVNIKFTGRISNEKVYCCYLQDGYNLFVNTSSAEGLPVSIMEAISFGIPVVATNAGGTGEIVIDGITGRLLPVETNPKEIANAISTIAHMSDANYFSLCTSSRKLWEDKFQAKKNYKRFALSLLSLFESQ